MKDKYFSWLCSLITTEDYKPEKYSRLLLALHSCQFTYSIALDDNRYADGVDLRYLYGYQNDIPDATIASEIDTRPCSVLEMMVALANRCEVHIMADDSEGNRTGKWFWDMVKSLKLIEMDDIHFDSRLVDYRIHLFLERKYLRNGEGGLFTVKYHNDDMRTVEIWYQLALYLQENT